MKNNLAKKVNGGSHSGPSKRYCSNDECKSEAANKGYCRLHYISHWKLLRLNTQMKAEKRLNAYVEKIAKKYPVDWIQKIKEGVEDEAKFRQTTQELDIEVSVDEPDTNNEFLEKFMRTVKPDGEK